MKQTQSQQMHDPITVNGQNRQVQETERRLVVARGWGGVEGVTTIGTGFF